MKPCHDCDLDTKLDNCCSANPETGESVRRRFPDGIARYACPGLSPRGRCADYENAPSACHAQQCEAFASTDLVRLLYDR